MSCYVALVASTWEAVDKASPQVAVAIFRRGGTFGFRRCFPPPVVKPEPGFKSGVLEKEAIKSR